MADFAKILATLRTEEKQLTKRAAQIRNAIQALSEVPIPLGKPKGPKKAAEKKRGRRKMTAAQKKAISKRMKKMWAEKKKKTKTKKKPTKG